MIDKQTGGGDPKIAVSADDDAHAGPSGRIPDAIDIVDITPAPILERFNLKGELERIEKDVEQFKEIKRIALRMTTEKDWVDQDGGPYLMDRGAENIAIPFGISTKLIGRPEKMLEEDNDGRYYIYVARGIAWSRKLGRAVEDVGVCSSRDLLLGRVRGAWRKIEEVDQTDIIRKSATNLNNRLIKRCVGLVSVTFEDLKAAGLDIAKIQKISYEEGKQRTEKELSAKAKEMRDQIWKMLIELTAGVEAEALLRLGQFSAFKKDDQTIKKASRLEDLRTEGWIKSTYYRVKAEYEKQYGKD